VSARTSLELLSTSRATDGAWMAAADVASAAEAAGVEYRLVGGNAVTLLTHVHGVAGRVPERETADADMGASMQVCGSPGLLAALPAQAYAQLDGSRFERKTAGRVLTIDLLAPSYSGTMLSNQAAGPVVVDAVPGLGLALARPATVVAVAVVLSHGERIAFSVHLPDLLSALVLKSSAYRGRFADRDALDVWRLLEAAHSAGIRSEEWPGGTEGRDGALSLRTHFGDASSAGPKKATREKASQARIRALVNTLVPDPRRRR